MSIGGEGRTERKGERERKKWKFFTSKTLLYTKSTKRRWRHGRGRIELKTRSHLRPQGVSSQEPTKEKN